MAIGSDTAIHFFGTQDTLDNTTSSVLDGAFSDGTNDLSAWTNDDDAPMAHAVFEGTFSVAPDAGSSVALYARKIDIGNAGTEDEDAPDANNTSSYVGSFGLNDVTSAQTKGILISLPNSKTSQIYNFYIQNNAGQTLSASWSLHITPVAIGPHA
tara:strand:+ start:11535 stop:11999 length:465 start_codon:yes stop_codon:yes gene_type:complete